MYKIITQIFGIMWSPFSGVPGYIQVAWLALNVVHTITSWPSVMHFDCGFCYDKSVLHTQNIPQNSTVNMIGKGM